MRPRRHSATRLSRQATELALAVPQVVAHRVARMALAGPTLSARDRKEFHGMGQEKMVAFWQSWFGMGLAATQMWQKAWSAGLQGARVPLVDVSRVLSQGMAPVHRKATANAKRLARTPLR